MVEPQEYIDVFGILRLTHYRGVKKYFVESLDETGKVTSKIYFNTSEGAALFGEVYFMRYKLGNDE